MDGTRLTYTSSLDSSPETELNTLAAIYCFVLFESVAGKKITEQAPNLTAARTPEASKQERRLQ